MEKFFATINLALMAMLAIAFSPTTSAANASPQTVPTINIHYEIQSTNQPSISENTTIYAGETVERGIFKKTAYVKEMTVFDDKTTTNIEITQGSFIQGLKKLKLKPSMVGNLLVLDVDLKQTNFIRIDNLTPADESVTFAESPVLVEFADRRYLTFLSGETRTVELESNDGSQHLSLLITANYHS